MSSTIRPTFQCVYIERRAIPLRLIALRLVLGAAVLALDIKTCACTALAFLLLELDAHVHALSFDIHVRERANTLTRRATGDHTVPVANTRNSEYIANVTLGGREIPVLLDTGRYAS